MILMKFHLKLKLNFNESDFASLEKKIEYEFSVKGLLLEAITHLSEKELGIGCCYEVVAKFHILFK